MKNKADVVPMILKHLKVINNSQATTSDFTAAVAALDALFEKEAANLDSDLRHFIARRSYGKALAFLEKTSDPIPRGICGRGG